MRWQLARNTWAAPVAAGALAFGSTGAAAAGEDWQYSATVYLWAAGINGETAGGAEIDVDFDTLLDNLNMGFMATLEARRGPWSFVADAVYLNIGANGSASVEVPVAPGSTATVDLDAGVKSRGWALNLLGAYTVWANEQASLDVLAGARYLELKAEFDLGVAAGQYRVERSRSVLGTAWDGVVGIKGRVNLGDRWHLPYYLDVGTGDSDFTWQAFGGVGYTFDWGEVSLVYRHIDWDFGSGGKLDDLNFSGPAAAVTWHF